MTIMSLFYLLGTFVSEILIEMSKLNDKWLDIFVENKWCNLSVSSAIWKFSSRCLLCLHIRYVMLQKLLKFSLHLVLQIVNERVRIP